MEADENLIRKEFTLSERVEALKTFEKREELEARERMGKASLGKLSLAEKGQARDKLAKLGGFGSGRQYEKAKKIVESGKRSLIQKMNFDARKGYRDW